MSRPVLFHYTARRPALQEIARRTFEAARNGTIRAEARRTSGALVLLP